MPKFQIDEAKRVVRATDAIKAVQTLPELDDISTGVFNSINPEEGVWIVTLGSESNKSYTVRETVNNDYEKPSEPFQDFDEIAWSGFL